MAKKLRNVKAKGMAEVDVEMEDSSETASEEPVRASQKVRKGVPGSSPPPVTCAPLSDPEEDEEDCDEDDDEDEDDAPPPHSPSRRRRERSPSTCSSSSSWSPVCESRTKRGGQASKRLKLANSDVEAQSEGWHTKDEPDIAPPTWKFEPKHPPGPRIDTSVSWTPLSLFKLFFSSSVLHTIVNNTNANAARRLAQGARFKWSSLSVDKFYIFLSIILFFGLTSLHARADYWRKEWPYNFPFPRNNMNRDTFEAIFCCLHLCDVKEDEKNEKKKGTTKYDRLFKIKPLYSEIVNACCALYQPKQQISIDERMLASKARVGFRQSMKDNPTKHGFKFFVLAEPQTGYTFNFFVYQGKDHTKVKRCGAKDGGLNVTSVMDLIRFDILGKGYHLYVDSYHTSPQLFNTLAQNHTGACGTIQSSKEGFPKTTTNDFPAKPEKGDMRWIRRGNLLFVRWVDTKIVNVCSTIHKAYSGATTLRKRKGDDGHWRRNSVAVPDACKDYNTYMGGVDLSDALIRSYSVRGKTMQWYKTFFYHFIDIAVVNSYILHKAVVSARDETPLTPKRFREVLMGEMIEQAKAVVTQEAPRSSLTNTCLPMYRGNTAGTDRRNCVLCAFNDKMMAMKKPRYKGKNMKTAIYCTKCKVSLCLVPERNCFVEYHRLAPPRPASQ